MKKIYWQKSINAHWYQLVCDACQSCNINLPEDIEHYLVLTLDRFTKNSKIASSKIGEEYLQGCQLSLGEKERALREIGDKCLILCGFFPGLAERRRVRIHYFVKMGQRAYQHLSSSTRTSESKLYAGLAKEFVSLMDVLQSMREVDENGLSLTPLEAEELWQDTHSQHAKKLLQTYTSKSVGEALFINNNKRLH